MKLRQKLVLGALSITIIPVAIVSVSLDTISFSAGRSSLEEQAKNQLVSVRDARKDQLETYLNSLQNQVKTFSNDLMVIEATRDLFIVSKIFDRNRTQTSQLITKCFANIAIILTTIIQVISPLNIQKETSTMPPT